MIFILGSFFVGVSLIKIFLSKNNKEDKSIEDLIKEYEIIDSSVCKKSIQNNDDNNKNKEENKIPVITIEHLNKIDENLENKIKDLGIKKNNNNDNENQNNNINQNNNKTAEERIFHTIMKKGNLYNDEYKRTIDNYVVIEFLKLAKQLNINLEESINDDNFDQIYIRYVDELVRKKLD
jgi:hypothetical protein